MTSAYIQLSSSVDQTPQVTSPVPVEFNIVQACELMAYVPEHPSEIKITEDGAYFIVAAGQVGRKSGSLLRQCDLWFRVNGVDVPNTGVRCSAPASLFAGDTTVLVSQVVLPLKQGDALEVMMSVNAVSEGLGLITFTPEGESVIPSIIFSMFRV